MRRLAVIVVGFAATAHAQPLACPNGTSARSTHGDTIEEWCERPDKTRHGPYRSAWAPGGRARQTEGMYTNGLQDGVWTTWRSDGTPWEQTHYRRGRKHGPWIVRDTKGRLEVDGAFEDGEQHGAWVWWHRNGKRKASGEYVRGREHGAWTEWDEVGRITSQGSYHAGLQIGTWLVDDGYHAARGTYCKGKRCGPWNLFVDGWLDAEGEYRDDARSGVWTHWLERQLRARGPYLRGKKHGLWTFWNEDGRLQAQIECRAGQPHGRRREWWDSGKPKLDAAYIDGDLHAEQLEIDEDGTRRSARYDRGRHVSGDAFEPDEGAGIEADGAGGRRRCEGETSMWTDDE